MAGFKIHSAKLLLSIALFLLIVGGVGRFIQDNQSFDESEVTELITERINSAIREARQVLIDKEASKYPLFTYSAGELQSWTDTQFIPNYRQIRGNYDLKFIRTIRHDFIAVKAIQDSLESVVIIPLYDKYKIENEYFQTAFNPEIFFNTSGLLLINSGSGKNEICFDSTCLFGIEYTQAYDIKDSFTYGLTSGVVILGAILILTGLYFLCDELSRKGIGQAILVLFGSLVLVRYAFYELDWPNALIESSLTDSRTFASSFINSSLADLFYNTLILLTFLLFINQRLLYFRKVRNLFLLDGWRKSLIGILLIGAVLMSVHWIYLLYQTVYHNSQISFDINTSISFSLTRSIAIITVLIFSWSMLIMANLAYRVVRQLIKSNQDLIIHAIIAIALFGGINLSVDQHWLPSALVGGALILIILLTDLSHTMVRIRYTTFLYFFLLMTGVSMLGSWSIYEFENEREIDKKKKFANQFLIDNDQMAEFLLSVVNDKIKNDLFIQSRMASPFLSKDVVESKIRQVYLSNYFDKYDVRIFMYDANGKPFDASTGRSNMLMRLNSNEFKTGYEGIYFINQPQLGSSKRYLDYIEVKRRGLKVGTIIIDMRLKRIIPENVYPEMLVDNRFLTPFQGTNYSYAVFDNTTVTYSSGDFNYDPTFVSGSGYKQQDAFSYGGYKHIATNDAAGHRIVISSMVHPLTDVISNFSFLFLIQVFALLLIIGFYAVYSWSKRAELTYSTRIQLYLNLAFFLPLFAVSITTLSLINASFEKEVKDEYLKKAEDIGNNLSPVLSDYIKGITNEDELKHTISDIARYSAADINVFSTDGLLLASNQPAIYDNQLLSEYINPVAFTNITQLGMKSQTLKEKVGKLEYNSTYFGVKSFESGELIGLVSIPFFDSERALQESQIVVVTNIINVFTFVFIAFLIISYFATEWLTFPLAFITQKLKRTTLTEFNEPLQWKSDDEIGLMVSEYNRMLVNLEESKRALARSEKQSAWREIAQQVAHEIKNPLTPMKLTLQHLNRKLTGAGKDEERSKPIQSLLQQIDTLDDIASSFSSFAKMPIPESERYELTEVLKKTVALHSATKDATIDLQLPDHKVYTLGDENLMGRIISNLLLNAIQSEGVERKINVSLTQEAAKILLKVEDNGAGIPEGIRPKIFVPNFTTKSTGSGIGLAIAKHGIEHAGGKIWFESVEGEGTTFYIELLADG